MQICFSTCRNFMLQQSTKKNYQEGKLVGLNTTLNKFITM